MPSALEIARKAVLRPVTAIAAEIGIATDLLEPYGEYVAKVKLDAIEALADRPRARYVVVTAVTPTPLGEGKTTTTIGLGQGMATSASGPPSPSARRRWARPSGSRAGRPAAATARRPRSRRSTST